MTRHIDADILDQLAEEEHESCQQQHNALKQSKVTSSGDAKHNSRPNSPISNAKTPNAQVQAQVQAARERRKAEIRAKQRALAKQQAREATERAKQRNEKLKRKLAEQRRIAAKHSEEMKAKQRARQEQRERAQQRARDGREQEKRNHEEAIQRARSRIMSTLTEKRSQLPTPTPIASRSGLSGESGAIAAKLKPHVLRCKPHSPQRSNTEPSTSKTTGEPTRSRHATSNESIAATEFSQAEAQQAAAVQQESSTAAATTRRRVTKPRPQAVKGKFLMPRDITIVWKAMAENA